MPSLEWNECWSANLKQFQKGELRKTEEEGYFYGDHWGAPEETNMLQIYKDKYIKPYIDKNTIALEIGAGGGRITQFVKDVKLLNLIDLHQEMLDYIKSRFNDPANFNYIQTNGTDLPGIEDESIDYIYSFDVFVHLDLPIIEQYVKNIHKALKKDGILNLHFSNKRKVMAWKNKGFSFNYPESMVVLLQRNNFDIQIVDDELVPHSSIIIAKKI